MSRIQAKAGESLADVYDVRGSIAGLDELETKTVQAVHELGATIFSERLRARVISGVSGDKAASASFDFTLFNFTAIPFIRIHQIFVFTDTTSRLADVAVSIEDEKSAGTGMPIWVWNGSDELAVRTSVAGSPTNTIALVPSIAFGGLPSFMVGRNQPGQESSPNLTVRGNTSAFGAGDVEVTAHALVSFPILGGVNSRGLPVPGW